MNINCCGNCKKLLDFKRANICTVDGKPTELTAYCTHFVDKHDFKQGKRAR